MTGCCDDVQNLLTSVNDPDKHIRIVYVGRPDEMWRSYGCYVCECRVPLPERVRIGESRHVYSWRNPDGVIQMRMRVTCHQEMCATCHQGGGVPTICASYPTLKNLYIYP